MKLFRYAVLLHPTAKEKKEETAETKVIVAPTPYKLYNDANAVMMAAISSAGVTSKAGL